MPDAPVFLAADPGRIEQVIQNLLTNAVTYAPDAERIDVRLARDGDWAELAVRDYGPGVRAAEREQIFTRLFQSQNPATDERSGLGLGLFIAREIAVAHGGMLMVESVEGEGATFTLRLPLADVAALEEAAGGAGAGAA